MVAVVGFGEASDWAHSEQPHANSMRSDTKHVAVLQVISACRANGEVTGLRPATLNSDSATPATPCAPICYRFRLAGL